MFKFLLQRRQGRFLLLGVITLVIAFMLQWNGSPYANYFFYLAMFFLGYYATKNAILETIQNHQLNVDLLMVLAAVGACLIDYASEGAILLLIFAGAELLEDYASGRSSRAIEELMAQVPETADLILANGETQEVAVEDLKPGDQVLVAKGAQVPIDGYTDRLAVINEAALTGESVPVNKEAGQEVFAGTINQGNAIQVKVSKASSETIFSNIIRMVEQAQGRPSRISRFIDRIENRYVMAVLVVVPIFIAILYYGQGLDFQEAFYRGMVFLTVASPCALVASSTPSTLSAISNGARNGVLFKGGAAMEALSTMDVLYSDKTGTLTEGVFEVVHYQADQRIIEEVVYMEQQSSHPIAEAIVDHFKGISLADIDTSQEVQEIAGSGLQKGAIRLGKPADFETGYQDPQGFLNQLEAGLTTVVVAEGDTLVGFFQLADQIRTQAKAAVQDFIADQVDVVLITGDHPSVAAKVASQVGIDHYQASMKPADKIQVVQEGQGQGHVVGMIGDGINDAPALAQADIGIAMGSGSSVAMESADLVIVQNDLSKLFHSFELSKHLNTIIKQNVIFAVGVIIALIIMNLFGLLPLPLAVVCHEGSTILVILNGLRLLAYGDR
ncbi:heavy metal translocating P-type ATPase [Hutsoniella sourekii]|uniref:heavy metal translocating P-type ATPase n=1 Tax=Hutsoniella sourekii TaxID=87650 RepID=UPI000483DE4F|nr:heavy metal translocating P-type ATPase [Hutsoniella sourekii]